MSKEELTLIDSAKNGNQEAFEKLAAIYKDKLYRFISSKMHEHYKHDVDDVVQETWLKVFENLNEFNPKIGNFEAFLIYNANIFTNRARQFKAKTEKRLQLYGITYEKNSDEQSYSLQEEVYENYFDSFPQLVESENNDLWNIGICAIFNGGKPHQIIIFNFNWLICPAKRQKHKGFPTEIVEHFSNIMINSLVKAMERGFKIEVGRALRKEQIKPFKIKINKAEKGEKVKIKNKKLNTYFRKDPEKSVNNWSRRVRSKAKDNFKNCLNKETYNELRRRGIVRNQK